MASNMYKQQTIVKERKKERKKRKEENTPKQKPIASRVLNYDSLVTLRR